VALRLAKHTTSCQSMGLVHNFNDPYGTCASACACRTKAERQERDCIPTSGLDK